MESKKICYALMVGTYAYNDINSKTWFDLYEYYDVVAKFNKCELYT